MWRILLGLLALAGSAHAQAYGNQFNVKTFPETGGTFTVSTTGTQTAGIIRGIGNFRRGVCTLKATAFNATGTILTDVFLQMTPDGGLTWTDYLRFASQAASGTPVTSIVSFSAELPSSVTTGAVSDANTLGLTGGTARQGPFGDQFRVRPTSGTTTVTFTFSIACAMAS